MSCDTLGSIEDAALIAEEDTLQLRIACALDPSKTPKPEDELPIEQASSTLFEENILGEEACESGITENNCKYV